MRNSAKSSLHKEISLLVRRFGLRQVRTAVANISAEDKAKNDRPTRTNLPKVPKASRPTISNLLQALHSTDPEKHYLLSEFFIRLKDREVLPESQDIRFFAQIIGLKEIRGKSRKDMIPTLMHFLFQLPTDILRFELRRAASISQQQRQEGFSVLTDKLLSHR